MNRIYLRKNHFFAKDKEPQGMVQIKGLSRVHDSKEAKWPVETSLLHFAKRSVRNIPEDSRTKVPLMI